MIHLFSKTLSKNPLLLATSLLLSLIFICSANAQSLVLVDNGQASVTIVTAENSSELTRRAADDLVHYVREISGATLPEAHQLADVKTPGILWIGAHRELQKRHPHIDFSLNNPEETLIQTAGKDVIILGRDRFDAAGTQLEAGTFLAVQSFIENQLGVRWLWPGKFGTDIPRNATLSLAPLAVRYTPQIHLRKFRWTSYERIYSGLSKENQRQLAAFTDDPRNWAREKDRITRAWLNHHRADAFATGEQLSSVAGSLFNYQSRHAFSGWYAKYGNDHPEWFALQPDGTRTPYPSAKYAKMCISNPEVAEQWLKNAKEFFENNPDATTFATGENDRGWEGYCVCANCLAWDNTSAEILESPLRWKDESRSSYALTDRYAKFWNIVARRLKEEFPGRDVNVSTYAYHITRPAPTIPLQDNVIPAYVGVERRNYFRNSQEHTIEQRKIWENWWIAVGKRNSLVWRPNIINKTFGLPYIFTQRHAENMRFLADHGLTGFDFDSTGSQWAAQGPQLYMMAKLAWDPRADHSAILSDYYQRAFGPAAPLMQKYFQGFEGLFARLAEQYKEQGYHIYMDPPRLFREIRQDAQPATARLGQEGVARNRAIEEASAALLKEAQLAVEGSAEIYGQRVQFVKTGFDFIQAQLDVMEANNDFRDNPTPENRQRILDAFNRREDALRAQNGTFAVDELRTLAEIQGHSEYVGIPAPKRKR